MPHIQFHRNNFELFCKYQNKILNQILILIADAKFSTKILGQGKFVKTKRGSAQLVDLKGFRYNKTEISRLDHHRVFWTCTRRSRDKCTARATTEGLNIISVGNHTHTLEGKELKFYLKKIKSKKGNTQDSCLSFKN